MSTVELPATADRNVRQTTTARGFRYIATSNYSGDEREEQKRKKNLFLFLEDFELLNFEFCKFLNLKFKS